MRTDWRTVALVAVLILLGWREVSGFFDGRERRREQEALAELQTEKAVLVAEKLEWGTAQAEGQRDLLGKIQDMQADSGSMAAEIQELTGELAALNVRLISVTEVEATTEGRISTAGTEHRDAVAVDSEVEIPADSVTAPLDDGILSGRVAYFPAPQTFDLIYSARIGGTLIHSRTPDGRLLVTAKADDERVTFRIPSLEYQLPEDSGGCGVFCVVGRVIKYGLPAYALGKAGLP